MRSSDKGNEHWNRGSGEETCKGHGGMEHEALGGVSGQKARVEEDRQQRRSPDWRLCLGFDGRIDAFSTLAFATPYFYFFFNLIFMF